MNDAYRGSTYVILNTTGVPGGKHDRLVNVLNRVSVFLSLSSSSISNTEECCLIRSELIRSVIYYGILRRMLLNNAD